MNIPSVFVYQMAKVGSSAIVNALLHMGIKSWHGHWLRGEWPEAEFPTKTDGLSGRMKADRIPAATFITPVRSPVARTVSSLMQQRGRYNWPDTGEQLYDVLVNDFVYTYPDKWFEHELLWHTGFDALAQPFDHSQGYSIYKHERHAFVIMRLEDANDVFGEMTRRTLGKAVPMITRNAWRGRINGELLQAYLDLRKMPLPEEFIDKCQAMEYAQKYYLPEELARFKRRWLNGFDTRSSSDNSD